MHIIIPVIKYSIIAWKFITNNGTELFINKTRDINIKPTRRSYITFRYYSLICILRQILQLIVQSERILLRVMALIIRSVLQISMCLSLTIGWEVGNMRGAKIDPMWRITNVKMIVSGLWQYLNISNQRLFLVIQKFYYHFHY